VLGKPAEIVTMRQGVETIEVAAAVLAASSGCTAVRLADGRPGLADLPVAALPAGHRAAR